MKCPHGNTRPRLGEMLAICRKRPYTPLKGVIFARHRERPKGVVAIQNCFTPLDYFTPFAIVKVMYVGKNP